MNVPLRLLFVRETASPIYFSLLSLSCPSGGRWPHGAAAEIWVVSPPRRTPVASVHPWILRLVPSAPLSLFNVGVSAALPQPWVKKQNKTCRVLKYNKWGENTFRFDVCCNNIVFYLYIHILVDAEPWLCCWGQKSQRQNGTLKEKNPLRI